jgi:hypothetical protein
LRRILGVGDEEEAGAGAVGGSTLMLKQALDDARVKLLVPMFLIAPTAPLASFFNPLILQNRQRQNSWRELRKGLVG